MSPEEFRRYGYEAVDWIADFLAHPERHPVLPQCQPGDLIDALPAQGPETGEPMSAILEDFRTLIVPALTHWNHPGFMAYFATSASPPGILGEMLATAVNPNGMLWKTAPAVTELEQVTLGWLREWMGLPPEFFGMIHDTASSSTLHAIAAARTAADANEGEGRLVMYASEQAHSSVEKAGLALGMGRDCLRKIPVDDEFRMHPGALADAIGRDLADGLRPFCVTATAGTTSTTSVDPIPAIAEIAARHRLWLHVDAAYAGAATLAPEFRWVLEGAEHADSLVMNPHKWMFTPVDLSAFYTRRPEVLRQTFSLVPEYLRSAEHPRAVNLMDYGVPLGRRFRALKLWFVLRSYGREGIARIIRAQTGYARELAALVDAHPDFERLAPVPFSVVCFRFKGTDERNLKLIERVNATGRAFLSHTVLHGKVVIRLAIGNMGTTREHVMDAWRLLRSEA